MAAQCRKLALTAGLCLALAFNFSCGQHEPDDNTDYGYISSSSNDSDNDSSSSSSQSCEPTETHYCRDGSVLTEYGNVSIGNQTYKTVSIGGITWMAENLNYDIEGSRCYENENSNCIAYGRLYDWEMAKIACPEGWHLSTFGDWYTLANFARIKGTEILKPAMELKSKNGDWSDYWKNNGNGTDLFGFAALPGGFGWMNYDTYSDNNGQIFYPGFYSMFAGEEGYWWTASGSEVGRARYFSMSASGDDVWYDTSKQTMLYSVRCVEGPVQEN